jgi:hypothetical protein
LPPVVDDVTVPLIAFVVLILAVAALALHQWWIYAVLAVDFILGRRCGPRASPGVKRPTAEVPERFAAGIGAALTFVGAGRWALASPAQSW